MHPVFKQKHGGKETMNTPATPHHFIPLHATAYHSIPLHTTPYHFIPLHTTSPHPTPLHAASCDCSPEAFRGAFVILKEPFNVILNQVLDQFQLVRMGSSLLYRWAMEGAVDVVLGYTKCPGFGETGLFEHGRDLVIRELLDYLIKPSRPEALWLVQGVQEALCVRVREQLDYCRHASHLLVERRRKSGEMKVEKWERDVKQNNRAV
jgi:hypothetical protein